MAGILPGVEYARRRRCRQSGGDAPCGGGGVRRPSLCLYNSNHDGSCSSITSLRSKQNEAYEDQKLGGVAREAKERLDERLKLQRKSSDSGRQIVNTETLKIVDAKTLKPLGELQTEVLGAKPWRWWLNLKKMRCKAAADEDECTICLEGFKVADHLVHLPCAHRFHSKCLLPWLITNAHCPCCRMVIHIEIPS